MNALALVLAGLAVFIMGYRFYTKFLVVAVFPSRNDKSTPAAHHQQRGNFTPRNRWILLAHNTAASAGILSITGVGIAALWGWIPAFLWVIVGTLVFGGTFALASLWASLRQDGNTLAGVVFEAAGAWAALPLFFLGNVLLVLLAAIAIVLFGQLLQAYPGATWMLLSLSMASALLRRAITEKAPSAIALWAGASFGALLLGIVLGQELPLHFMGASSLEINGISVFRISSELPWIVLGLGFAYVSLRYPISDSAQPRAVVSVVLLLIVLALTLAGLALTAPNIVAPDFNLSESIPGAFPLLFVVITGGAVSGIYAMFITSTTVHQVKDPSDAPLITFGSVMIDGMLAITVLAALCAGFASAESWGTMYQQWPAGIEVFVWLDIAITKLGQIMASTGIPLAVTLALVATMVAALALSLIENCLRTLSQGVEEFVEDFELDYLKREHYKERISVGAVIFTTICLLQVDLTLDHWLIFGLANLIFAGCFMLVLGLITSRNSGGMNLFVLLPALFLLGCAFWGTGWLLLHWWQNQAWALFTTTCLLAITTLTCLFPCISLVARNLKASTAISPPGV